MQLYAYFTKYMASYCAKHLYSLTLCFSAVVACNSCACACFTTSIVLLFLCTWRDACSLPLAGVTRVGRAMLTRRKVLLLPCWYCHRDAFCSGVTDSTGTMPKPEDLSFTRGWFCTQQRNGKEIQLWGFTDVSSRRFASPATSCVAPHTKGNHILDHASCR